MPRIAILVEYLGGRFHGSQLQLKHRTVQLVLEEALEILARQPVRVTFSGRTDSGVHASGQVAHFEWTDEECDLARLAGSINGIAQDDVAVRAIQKVPDSFHARFSATSRSYVYRILNHPYKSPILKDTHHHQPWPLDLESMSQAASSLIGKHDFTSFRSSNSDKSSPVCTVTRAEILKLGEGRLEFHIAADHFVYNMVRIIVGTLMEIGLGKKEPESMTRALEELDRNLAGPTAPPGGLTLVKVEYPEEYRLFEKDSGL